MGNIKRLAWWLCLLFACAMLLVTGTVQIQHLADAHRSARFYLLLSLLLAIPTSIVTLAAGYLLEGLLVGWSRSSFKALLKPSASVRLDMVSIAMVLLPHRRLGYVLSLGLLLAVDTHSLQHADISLTRFLPSWGLQIGCLVLLQSFFSYWMHRLEHTIPALWALHKFHHSAERMSILTAVRQSELTKGVEEIILLVFLALPRDPDVAKPGAGSPLFALVVIYFLYRTFVRVNQYLVHSNLSTDYGWIGRWLLVSPRMHRLHHATAPEYHDKNFTFDLVIWDRLFGTYATCDAAALGTVSLGLDDNPFNNGGTIKGALRDYFLTTYIVFWHALRTGVKAWLPARPLIPRASPEAPATPRPLPADGARGATQRPRDPRRSG
jgi:sterol desaturase/sphingolipid hydroxylase (fatty acid hydroxylase superfamily)